MYLGHCVAKRTRSKRKQYEEFFEDRGRHEKRSPPRNDTDLDISFVSKTEDKGEFNGSHTNEAPKVSNIRGESSKSKIGNKLKGEVKKKDKPTSHRYKDTYLISSEEDNDDFGGKNSKDIESVASATVPPAEEDIQEYSDDIIYEGEVKGKAKGKDLQREAEKNHGRHNSKVGNKVNKPYHEDEITSQRPNCSYREPYLLLSSDDDGDSKGTQHEQSVSSDTDTDSEEQSSSTEESSSESGYSEDEDYVISGHESSKSSKSDASYVEVVDSHVSILKPNFGSPQMGETRRNSAERQQSSIIVEIDFSSEEEEEEEEEKEEVQKEEEKDVAKGNAETNQLPKERRRHLRAEDDTFNILANSILFQDDMLEKMASEKLVEKQSASASTLPLKFSFNDEIPNPPENSDLDKEVDKNFDEMFFALNCEMMGSNSNANIDEEYTESSQTSQTQCDHVYVLDEEIGLICRHCRHVKTEIRYFLPSFATRTKRFTKEGSLRNEKGVMSDALGFESSSDGNINSSFETEGTIWDSLRGVRHSLYQHQREGFEFLWRNIGGSIDVSQLSSDSSEVGGCIISHAPGTGKTRLAIVFIESYLTLFPRSRPVIIAPANMLSTWEEEFDKWKVRFPFHNLNRDDPSGKEDKIALELISRSNKGRRLVRMSKLYSWDREDSILGISYSLYEKLAAERMAANEELKEKNNPWRNILLGKPELVILDEGHTPRNDQSNIWNILLKLNTRKIVMLSGTPFQNNVDELMNLLRLIRPEVEKGLRKERTFSELMPSLKSCPSHQYHGRQADPLKDEARRKAIHKLKAAIEPFVHVHKGSILQQTLPGLREYAIILNPLELQKSLLKELEVSNHFESDHKIALISAHPQLLELYSSRKERDQGMRQHKLDYSSLLPNEGAKTRFVLELVRLSLSLNEKTLIFSQYKEPLYLMKYLMESKFSWREGQQMFLVEGGLSQNKRQPIIHSFNDPNSEVKVLLASTKCCSEGISLIGASRVVLLDVVWNPSVAMQAISRAYRIGQKKVVYAYHLILSGTTEAAKYRRQAEKERLSELIFTSTDKEVDEQQRMPKIAASDDKILEAMVAHSSMKDIFERVVDRPKDSNFFR